MSCYETRKIDSRAVVSAKLQSSLGWKTFVVMGETASLLAAYTKKSLHLGSDLGRPLENSDCRLWHHSYLVSCNHNRCRLRNYIFLSLPWYHPIDRLFESIKHKNTRPERLHQPQYTLPFLQFPPEIRKEIYLHASHANTSHTIEGAQHRNITGPIQSPSDTPLSTTNSADHDGYPHLANTRRPTPNEDIISYRLNDNGIIAMHGAPPPLALLLANKQISSEANDAFWAGTVFEVQPLTPNDACWRLDTSIRPTYEALAESRYAAQMRRVRVRIDIARFRKARKTERFALVNSQVCTHTEIELDACTEVLETLAKELCGALKRYAPMLRIVEIEWVDDFSGEMDEKDLQSRARVLVPFTMLGGVTIRFERIVMAGLARAVWASRARQIFNNGV